MSLRLITIVERHSPARDAERAVLLCIASHQRSDEKPAFPSIATISRETGYCRATVQAALAALVASGQIERRVQTHRSERSRRNWNTNEYLVTLACPQHCDQSSAHRDKTTGRACLPPVPQRPARGADTRRRKQAAGTLGAQPTTPLENAAEGTRQIGKGPSPLDMKGPSPLGPEPLRENRKYQVQEQEQEPLTRVALLTREPASSVSSAARGFQDQKQREGGTGPEPDATPDTWDDADDIIDPETGWFREPVVGVPTDPDHLPHHVRSSPATRRKAPRGKAHWTRWREAVLEATGDPTLLDRMLVKAVKALDGDERAARARLAYRLKKRAGDLDHVDHARLRKAVWDDQRKVGGLVAFGGPGSDVDAETYLVAWLRFGPGQNLEGICAHLAGDAKHPRPRELLRRSPKYGWEPDRDGVEAILATLVKAGLVERARGGYRLTLLGRRQEAARRYCGQQVRLVELGRVSGDVVWEDSKYRWADRDGLVAYLLEEADATIDGPNVHLPKCA